MLEKGSPTWAQQRPNRCNSCSPLTADGSWEGAGRSQGVEQRACGHDHAYEHAARASRPAACPKCPYSAAPVLIHIIIVFLRILDVVVRHGYEAFLQAVDHALMRLADRPVARRDVVGLLLLAEGCWLKARSPV